MNVYRFGATLNVFVILCLSAVFALLHFYNPIGEFIMDNIVKPLGFDTSSFQMSDLLFTNTNLRDLYIPIIISLSLVILFFLVGVGPLAVINHLIKSDARIGLTYFIFATLLSLPLGGGLFMLIGLIGLRPSIYVKRNVYANTIAGRYQSYSYDIDTIPIENPQPIVNQKEKFLEDPNWKPNYGNFSVAELKNRVESLEKENAQLEENLYFKNRRQNRRIDNLEIDLASERRHNRRHRY